MAKDHPGAPAAAYQHTLSLRKIAHGFAEQGLPAIGAEIRRVVGVMNSTTTVEYPLMLLMLAVAMLAEREQ